LYASACEACGTFCGILTGWQGTSGSGGEVENRTLFLEVWDGSSRDFSDWPLFMPANGVPGEPAFGSLGWKRPTLPHTFACTGVPSTPGLGVMGWKYHRPAGLVWGGHSCPPLRQKSSQISGLTVTDGFLFCRWNSGSTLACASLRGQECSRHTKMQFVSNSYEYRRRLPHYQKADRVLFVTFCTLGREQLAAEARDVVLRHSIHDHGKRYLLHAAVVMPDHVHLMLTPLRDENGWPHSLASILKLIKGTSAREVNKLLGHEGPLWQEESFDHVLRGKESFAEKLEYIRRNPVRKGFVDRPEDYRWLWIEDSGSGGLAG
jgi:putative transposase